MYLNFFINRKSINFPPHPRTEESLELEKNELEEGEYRGAVVTQAQP